MLIGISAFGVGNSAGTAFAPPIAAAWLYMSDDQDYTTIPSHWPDVNFANVDILYVAPAGIQADGTFGLYDSVTTGPLAHRFEWVIRTSRSQNPNIKIIASQFWGYGPEKFGSAFEKLNNSQSITKYTNSVRTFLQSWLSVSGGVDGYDIDYEDNNVVDIAPKILEQVRNNLDTLSKSEGGRPFYVTISPASTQYLDKAVPHLSYVNMQTYAGSMGLSAKDFTEVGFQSSQLLYGICPESNCGSPTLNQTKDAYTKNQLAGIHTWRLNSGNYEEEDNVQAEIYTFLHPT